MHATTILGIKKGKTIVLIGDGQVTQGNTVKKGDVKKIREIKSGIICGFAGFF
jgi:ATP-dependent HslUV protease subunit HslV